MTATIGELPKTLEAACLADVALRGEGRYPTYPFATAGLYGGQLLAITIVEAVRTSPPRRRPVAATATVLRPGHGGDNVRAFETFTRDGKTLSHRSISLAQGSETVSTGSVILATEEGLNGPVTSSPVAVPLPEMAGPDALPTLFERRWNFPFLEFRPVLTVPGVRPALHPVWLRSRTPWPDDVATWTAQAFLTDLAVVRAALEPEELKTHGVVTVEHVLYPHEEIAPDDWNLLTAERRYRNGSTALVDFSVVSRNGRVCATGTQVVQVLPPR